MTTDELTHRQRDVLSRIAQGMSLKQVAFDLGISYNTVRNHLHECYIKLGVQDRYNAVRVYYGGASERRAVDIATEALAEAIRIVTERNAQ